MTVREAMTKKASDVTAAEVVSGPVRTCAPEDERRAACRRHELAGDFL